jgi:hypothetical protein
MATERIPPAQGSGLPETVNGMRKVTQADTTPDFSVLSRENMATLLDLDTKTLDPAFKYRWVNKTSTKFSRAKLRGYILVEPDKEEIKTLGGGEPDISTDGYYQCADVVLMKVPKARYKQRRILVRKKTQQRLTSVTKQAKRRMRKAKRDVTILDNEED